MIASGGQPIAEPPTEPWHVSGSFLGSNSNEGHTGKLEASGSALSKENVWTEWGKNVGEN